MSPDGKTFVVGDRGGGLLMIDTRTFEPIGTPLRGVDGDDPFAYSPNGETLVAGGDGHIRLFDTRTRKQLKDVRIIENASRVAFTPDGSRLVVVESEPEGASWITIRDADTLRQIGPEIEPDGFQGHFLSQ